MVGGLSGLIGAAIAGPRTDRFKAGKEHLFRAHNVPL